MRCELLVYHLPAFWLVVRDDASGVRFSCRCFSHEFAGAVVADRRGNSCPCSRTREPGLRGLVLVCVVALEVLLGYRASGSCLFRVSREPVQKLGNLLGHRRDPGDTGTPLTLGPWRALQASRTGKKSAGCSRGVAAAPLGAVEPRGLADMASTAWSPLCGMSAFATSKRPSVTLPGSSRSATLGCRKSDAGVEWRSKRGRRKRAITDPDQGLIRTRPVPAPRQHPDRQGARGLTCPGFLSRFSVPVFFSGV